MSVKFREEKNIGFIEFDQADSKVNVLTRATLNKLDALLDDVAKRSGLKAVVFQSLKKDCFLAGADIKEIEQIVEPTDGAVKAKAGQDIMNKIEDLNIPTIAVIDGVALGGGCELILACHYRVATFNPKIKIGLPEVNLGFVPGFGGTYRLPRTIGLMQGLTLILTGKPVDGSKAYRLGLVDHLTHSKEVHTFVEDVISGQFKKKRYQPLSARGPVKYLEKFRFLNGVIYSQSRKNVLKTTKGFYPAPLKAIDVVSKNFYTNRQEGMEIERKAFGDLAVTEISKNCVHLFYISEKYKKLSLPDAKDIQAQNIEKCGVLGAGVMGGGIAQLLATRDIWVRVKDLNYEAIALGLRSAADIFKKAVQRRRYSSSDAMMKMGHITGTLDYKGFGNVDYVIEAVVENMKIKKAVFKELSEVTSNKAILATNTSALSVKEMASVTKDPSKVIGFHFFNPVHRMPLVEVITTEFTSKETIMTTLNFVRRLGKTPILVKDSPGFIVNRILLTYMAEAGRILEETGDFERIDHVITRFGMPMGPFLLSDEVGMDVGLKVMHILEEAFGERFKPVAIFEKFYELGDLGKKTGKGFYIHQKRRSANPVVQEIVKGTPVDIHDDEIEQRLIFSMINEAAMCLEEGIVDEPHAIDVGMVFGTGFPPFRGGLLRYADSVGLEVVVERLHHFQNKYKVNRYEPTALLERLAQDKKKFYDS